MRGRIFCALGLAAAALAAPAVGGGTSKPSLRVTRALPMTIRGADFRVGDSVRVTVVMGTRRFVQQARAGSAGGFTVTWPGVRLNWCAMPLAIDARGARTGKVAARIPVAQCPPP